MKNLVNLVSKSVISEERQIRKRAKADYKNNKHTPQSKALREQFLDVILKSGIPNWGSATFKPI